MKQQWSFDIVIGKHFQIVLMIAVVLLLIQPKIALATELANDTDYDNYNLQINLETNLTSFSGFLSDNVDQDIRNVNSVPDIVLANGEFILNVPLQRGANNEWGFFWQIDEKFRGLGDTIAFFHDASNMGTVPGRIYDLQGRLEEYKFAGLYKTYQFEQGGFKSMIRGNCFVCLDYQSADLLGIGILDPQAGTDKITIYANCKKSWLKPGAPLGCGASVVMSTQAKWDSGIIMRLNVANLPGFVYFPSITSQSAEIDTVEENLSPINLNGFIRDHSALVQLPIAVTGSLLLPVSSNGSLEFNAYYSNLFQDFAIGYLYNLKKGIVKVEISPIMEDITFGYIWEWGNVHLSYVPANGAWSGVKMAIKF